MLLLLELNGDPQKVKPEPEWTQNAFLRKKDFILKINPNLLEEKNNQMSY